jgi:hypothetical protein
LLSLTAGCGGLNVTKSISPLDFFLPGLLQADPPPEKPERVTPEDEESLQQIAQN